MNQTNKSVCPARIAGFLDNRFRRWLQKPERILAPYVREGMVALDLGCGPGFFTVPMARMIGQSGHVIACDVQAEMLDIVRAKIRGTELDGRIRTHLCKEDSLGITEQVDFVLAFYMMHEAADPRRLLGELGAILRPEGRVLVVEPPIHVSHAAFFEFCDIARAAGFVVLPGPHLWPNRTAILHRGAA